MIVPSREAWAVITAEHANKYSSSTTERRHKDKTDKPQTNQRGKAAEMVSTPPISRRYDRWCKSGFLYLRIVAHGNRRRVDGLSLRAVSERPRLNHADDKAGMAVANDSGCYGETSRNRALRETVSADRSPEPAIRRAQRASIRRRVN